MRESLTAEGYEQTKEKLRDLETRLAEIEKRTDLSPDHLESVRRSYKMMMREFLQEIKLYEATHGKTKPLRFPMTGVQGQTSIARQQEGNPRSLSRTLACQTDLRSIKTQMKQEPAIPDLILPLGIRLAQR